MAKKFKYALRVAILVLYGCYALSPICLSVAGGDDRAYIDGERNRQSYSLGIVWVNVLLSSLLEEEIDGTTAPNAALSEQEPDLILIKKKRAVFREQYTISPAIETITLSFNSTHRIAPLFHDHEIPMDPQHRETDGYSSLHAGLSPPQHLS